MLMKEIGEGKELDKLLSSFSCEMDKDIEIFLHKRAVEFEKLSKARTYLICVSLSDLRPYEVRK